MPDQVFVLGCGPAGLLAAHAAAISGRDPVILSRKIKSPIGGAQYLHREIPGIMRVDEAETVTFIKKGSEAIYAKKVYGDMAAKTSWSDFESGDHSVWNMREAYSRLWDEYEDLIVDQEVNPHVVEELVEDSVVICSIPKRATCESPSRYRWNSQPVWIEYGQEVEADCGDMQIVYSGLSSHGWYRCSSIFGWNGVEWPEPVEGAVEIHKPLSTDFEGIPGVLYVGRYGKWQKGVLAHEAFDDVLDHFLLEDFGV